MTTDTQENVSWQVQDMLTHFLADTRMLRGEDLARLMGWNQDTLKTKIARREVPDAIRTKRLVLFKYSDVSAWLEENATKIEAKEPDEPNAASASASALLK